MTCILLFEYWTVEFLIYEVVVNCFKLRNAWEEEQSTWIIREWEFWLSCLGTSKKLVGRLLIIVHYWF